MKQTKEWLMVVELAEYINSFETDEQENFIRELYNNLDPHMPFLEQQNSNQETFLNYLYEKYVNDDEEAARELYDDAN